jgi:hypothetical protein
MVRGILLNNTKNDKLDATLINKENLIVTSDIPINYDNSFNYANPYFRDNAILFFRNAIDKKKKPSLKIETILDSTFIPTSSKYVSIKIGNTINPSNLTDVPKKFSEIDAFLGKKIKTQEMVTVKATNKSFVKLYEDKNINDLFKDKGERTLNLIEDNPGQYGIRLLDYLQSYLPSLSLGRSDGSFDLEPTIRGVGVVFYLDQIVIPKEFLTNIDLNDVAMIKVYNPPFVLNIDASNYAIAIFSKKDNNTANGKNSFNVKGYNSPIETIK